AVPEPLALAARRGNRASAAIRAPRCAWLNPTASRISGGGGNCEQSGPNELLIAAARLDRWGFAVKLAVAECAGAVEGATCSRPMAFGQFAGWLRLLKRLADQVPKSLREEECRDDQQQAGQGPGRDELVDHISDCGHGQRRRRRGKA